MFTQKNNNSDDFITSLEMDLKNLNGLIKTINSGENIAPNLGRAVELSQALYHKFERIDKILAQHFNLLLNKLAKMKSLKEYPEVAEIISEKSNDIATKSQTFYEEKQLYAATIASLTEINIDTLTIKYETFSSFYELVKQWSKDIVSLQELIKTFTLDDPSYSNAPSIQKRH